MPTLHEIQEAILSRKGGAQDEIRRRHLRKLHEYTGNDTILFATAFTSGKLPSIPAFVVSVTLEDVQAFMSALHGLKGDSLDLIIHSPGGQMEAAEQIVNYLRAKYQRIRAIIPQNAMSAATMMACACDRIIMGKHSAIGPIDPQVTFPTERGHFTAPAHAILKEFGTSTLRLRSQRSSCTLKGWVKFTDADTMEWWMAEYMGLCKTMEMSGTGKRIK